MKDTIIQTLTQYKYTLEDKILDIEQLEDNPFVFFEQTRGMDESELVRLLEQRDPQYVLDYQYWLFPKLMEEMKRRFNLEDYTLSFQPTNFPSPIQLTHEMTVVANLLPFERAFSYAVPSKMTRMLDQRRDLLLNQVQIEEDISLLELLELNPILVGKGKAWGTTKAMLSQKAVKKDLKDRAITLLDELSDTKRQIIELNNEIDQLVEHWMFLTLDLDRLSKRLQDVLGVDIYNPLKEIEENDIAFIEQELPQVRLNYRKSIYEEYGLNDDAAVSNEEDIPHVVDENEE